MAGGVDGVLAERQVGGVAEDLVQHGDGFPPGRRDDLGAVRGVLIGDMGVGGGAHVEEVPRQGAGGEASAALREPLPIGRGQGAAAPQGRERIRVVGVDQPGVRCTQRVLPQVPLGGPGQLVFGNAGGVGHPGVAEVARVGDQRRVQVAAQFRIAGAASRRRG